MTLADTAVTPVRHENRYAALIWGGYTRISEDPDDLRTGVTTQVEDVIDAITGLGGTPPALDSEHMHVENDTSAYKKRKVTITDHYGETRVAYRVIRPKWATALRALRDGKINALMVYDLDRLARDPYDLEDAIEAVEYFGATIVSASASSIDLMTESGRMAARIMVVMANKASADTARRVKRAHLREARKGTPIGGTRPFGFEIDLVTHRPDEAALLRQAAADIIAGIPLRTIAKQWQDAGVVSPRERIWRGQTVRQILKGPRLAGWRVYQGKIAVDKNGQPVRLRYPDTVRGVVDDQGRPVPHPKAGEPVEPILDQDTYDRVMQVLTRPETRRRKPRKGARHYLLTGLVRCGRCNALMYGNGYGNTNGEPRYYYVCRGTEADRHVVSISGHGTDALIERLVLDRLAAEDFDTPALEFTGTERLQQVKDSIAELMAAFTAGRLSGAIVFPQVEALEAERDRLDAERRAFIQATAGPSIEQVRPQDWEGFSTDEKRAHLERVLDAVMIRPAKQRQNFLDVTRIDPVWRGARPQ